MAKTKAPIGPNPGSSEARGERATVLGVRTVQGDEAKLLTTDAAAIDLADPQNWAQMDMLIRAKFLMFLEERFPSDSRQFEGGTISGKRGRELWDEFMIEQARTIGVRVLFSKTALIRLYDWTQQHDLGTKLWRRFANNVRDGFNGKRILIADDRTALAREELISDLKELRRRLLSKKAAQLEWDFPLHLSNLEKELHKSPGDTLESNASMFIRFVEKNEGLFRRWLLAGDDKVTHAKLANEFVADTHGYQSAESARQAIQKLKRRRTPKQRKKT